jgi:hypothetical protein
MKKQILELLEKAEPLIRKLAEKEKLDTEPKLFTEMLSDITYFYITECTLRIN